MPLKLKGPFGWSGGKVKGQKMVEGWKSKRIEKILISLILFGWEQKNGRMEKVSLYKFTHIPLLKNNAILKPKKG